MTFISIVISLWRENQEKQERSQIGERRKFFSFSPFFFWIEIGNKGERRREKEREKERNCKKAPVDFDLRFEIFTGNTFKLKAAFQQVLLSSILLSPLSLSFVSSSLSLIHFSLSLSLFSKILLNEEKKK